MITKIRVVLLHPAAFFKSYKNDTLSSGLGFFAVLSAVYTIVMLLGSKFFSGTLVSVHSSILNLNINNPLMYIPFTLILIFINIISVFLWCSLVHLSLLILKGKGDYHQTFNVIVYSLTPVLLFGWIPFVSYLAMLYHFIIFVKGVSIWHKVSHLKGVFAYIGPMLIILLIAVIFTLLGLSLIYGIFQVKLPGF